VYCVRRKVVCGTAGPVLRRGARPGCQAVLLAMAMAALAGCGRVPVSRTVLTSASQVRQLTAAQVRLGVPVRIRGILTYFDGISSYCFVQDATGGIRVGLAPGEIPPANGWRVEVAGLAASGGEAPAMMEARVSALGADSLPPAIRLSPSQLRDPLYEYKRVAVSGVVQSVGSERPGIVTLGVRAERTTVWAKVPASNVVVNEDSTDAEVRVSGVLAESLDANPGGANPTLWISDLSSLETTRPRTPPVELPFSRIHSLFSLGPAGAPAHRVRIRGAPYEPIQGGLAVVDEGVEISVRLGPFAPDPNATVLDLAGFLEWEHGRPVLDRAVFVDDVKVADRDQAPASGPALTTALAVHRLPVSLAQRAYPVHLRAVVTYYDPGDHLLFVQDSSDGIFVEPSDKETVSLKAGDDVEITGQTTADFAPDVAKARIKVLGHPGLPTPKIGRFGSANWGREDCHWIELEGVVQRVAQGRVDTLLTLAWGKNSYKAHVLAPAESLARLLDADVKVSGVCGALFNTRHQMLGIQMFVPGADCIRVLRAPPADPFAMVPTQIGDLLQFSRATDMGHRVRLQGTVTYPNRSGSTWVRDETGGVMLQDHDAPGLAAGDRVDVVGFPEIAGFGPVVRGAQIKRVQSGPLPVPVRIVAMDAMTGDYDGQLVEIDAKLIDRLQHPAEQVLTVESGEMVFTAHLPSGGATQTLEPGARLRLTGICSVEAEQSRDLILPRTFHLLLRSPADVVMVGRPPLLTARRVAPILAGATLLVMAALVWASLLRKRVRSQTFALRAQTVQLQAAHQRTREALRKACEAESLDLDSKRILELIARDEPVDLIVDQIAEAVALHCERSVCAILLGPPHGPRVCAVPPMQAEWLDALSRLALQSISFGNEFRAPRRFSDDPAWVEFIDSGKPRFRAFCSAPIVVDGSAAGAIAAFFREEKESGDAQCAQLGLWCNIAALALERRRLHDQLSYRAQHDGLTGLPNRALLYEQLELEIERASRGGGLLGVLYIDLNGFKQINDSYGHDAGDTVLRETAKRMIDGVRRGDIVARIGGDEFVVLLPLLGRREDAEQIAEKIVAALREPVYSTGQQLAVSACVGIGIWPFDADRADPLLRFADARMYGEKRRRWNDTQSKPEQRVPPRNLQPQ
jgi:diguanylate cyclase (GGDEF)-like protein